MSQVFRQADVDRHQEELDILKEKLLSGVYDKSYEIDEMSHEELMEKLLSGVDDESYDINEMSREELISEADARVKEIKEDRATFRQTGFTKPMLAIMLSQARNKSASAGNPKIKSSDEKNLDTVKDQMLQDPDLLDEYSKMLDEEERDQECPTSALIHSTSYFFAARNYALAGEVKEALKCIEGSQYFLNVMIDNCELK